MAENAGAIIVGTSPSCNVRCTEMPKSTRIIFAVLSIDYRPVGRFAIYSIRAITSGRVKFWLTRLPVLRSSFNKFGASAAAISDLSPPAEHPSSRSHSVIRQIRTYCQLTPFRASTLSRGRFSLLRPAYCLRPVQDDESCLSRHPSCRAVWF